MPAGSFADTTLEVGGNSGDWAAARSLRRRHRCSIAICSSSPAGGHLNGRFSLCGRERMAISRCLTTGPAAMPSRGVGPAGDRTCRRRSSTTASCTCWRTTAFWMPTTFRSPFRPYSDGLLDDLIIRRAPAEVQNAQRVLHLVNESHEDAFHEQQRDDADTEVSMKRGLNLH